MCAPALRQAVRLREPWLVAFHVDSSAAKSERNLNPNPTMNRSSFSFTLATLSLAAGAITAHGQSVATSVALPPTAPPSGAPPPSLSSTEQWIQDVKSPLSWFTWGGDLRIRDEYYNNIVSLSEKNPLHEQNVIRYRARLWSTITPVDDLSFNVRLAAEPRQWTRPAFTGTFRGDEGMEWRYGIFDNLNVKWNNVLEPAAHHHRRSTGHYDRRFLELVACRRRHAAWTAPGPTTSTRSAPPTKPKN